MKYLLLMYFHEGDNTPDYASEEFQEMNKAWAAFKNEVTEAGVLIANNGLSPVANATTVRVRDDKTLTSDGPFAETHEQLGGYFLLNCIDLDEAIGWAAKIPAAKYGSIEIRPLWSQD